MGSRSSSSSSSSQTTQQYDQRVAVESGGYGVGAGANVDVSITDAGALEQVASIAGELTKSVGAGFDAVTLLGEGAAEFAREIVTENNKVLAEAQEDNAKEISETLIWSIAGVAIVLGGVLLWRR